MAGPALAGPALRLQLRLRLWLFCVSLDDPVVEVFLADDELPRRLPALTTILLWGFCFGSDTIPPGTCALLWMLRAVLCIRIL